jgi:hydrogenase nickel incorporation protein HypA/HybF
MHEMPVTQAMLSMVLEQAGDSRVLGIRLRVGELSPVVPDSVAVFFEYLSRGTNAEGARLQFEPAPLETTCPACGANQVHRVVEGLRPQIVLARALARGCPCGAKALKLTGGVGFDIVDLEVADTIGFDLLHAK